MLTKILNSLPIDMKTNQPAKTLKRVKCMAIKYDRAIKMHMLPHRYTNSSFHKINLCTHAGLHPHTENSRQHHRFRHTAPFSRHIGEPALFSPLCDTHTCSDTLTCSAACGSSCPCSGGTANWIFFGLLGSIITD